MNKWLMLNHWVSTGIVSCLVGLLTFPGLIGSSSPPSHFLPSTHFKLTSFLGDAVLYRSPHSAFESLLSTDDLSVATDNIGPGYSLPPSLSLFFWLTTHFFLLPLILTLRIPNGISLPLMAIGGAFGRLFAAYTIKMVEPDVVLAGYALVGGAGLLASVTHTYSTTMIVMEMTGNSRFLRIIFLCKTSPPFPPSF